MKQELTIYLDGEYVKQSEAKISVFDQGVLFGDGVFEGRLRGHLYYYC